MMVTPVYCEYSTLLFVQHVPPSSHFRLSSLLLLLVIGLPSLGLVLWVVIGIRFGFFRVIIVRMIVTLLPGSVARWM